MRTDPSFADGLGPMPGQHDAGAHRQNALTFVPSSRDYAEPPPPQETPQGDFDIGLVLRTLWRRSPIILAMAVVGALVGVKLTAMITPTFTSSVSVLLEPKRADSTGADTLFGSVMVDTSKIASVVSVIESSDLLARVVAAEKLDEIPEFGDQPPSRLYATLGFLPFIKPPVIHNDPESRRGRALDRLQRAVRVDRVGYTYVLTIQARATKPDMAQRLAAAVANAYLNDQVERNSAAKERGSQWLTQRLNDARVALKQSEEALDAVRRKYGLADLGSGATVDRQALINGLNTQLTQAQADVANLQGRYEQAERARTNHESLEALPEVANSSTISSLRNTQAELAQKLSALRAVYNEDFPEIRHLKENQREVQTEIDTALARVVEGRRSEYEAAVARQQALGERLRNAVAAEGGAAGDEAREQVLDAQRLVDANHGLYEALVSKWREAQQQETGEEPEARIISQAYLPAARSSPKPMLLPIGGAAAMIFLGLALTLAPVLLDNKFASVTAVERRLGLRVLSAIPMLRRNDLGPARRRRRSIVEYTSRQPLSRFGECLRMLRAHLRISADGGSSVIQVTSSVAGEGKSTVASALAVSAATAGVRTVLVDGDVRSSAVSSMFGLRNEEGLTDVLELDVPVHSILRDREDMPLAVLGAGSSVVPRPDLIDSNRLVLLLRELSQSYSLIILDSPPVLPVSDALVLSKYADTTILVVQWRATPRRIAEQAVKMLRSVNAALGGVILNKIDLSKIGRYEARYSDYSQQKTASS
jgi:polysaccharide biosynthesis transport protein